MDSSENKRTHVTFPRLTLPPVPFGGSKTASGNSPEDTRAPIEGQPATNLDGQSVGGYDDTSIQWRYPYESFSSMPEPAPEPAPIESLDEQKIEAVIDAPMVSIEEPTPQISQSAPMLFLVPIGILAIVCIWASKMAFSASLLALSGMFVSELALVAASLRSTANNRSRYVMATALPAGAISILAVKSALAQFGDAAFVAGLFVLVTALPALIVLGVVSLVLRRRATLTPVTTVIRSGSLVRFGALVAVLLAGYQAFKTFSAKPDAVVALGITAVTIYSVVSAVRGTGRAAS